MKILLTGATGFIGKHLCQKLIDQNHQLIAWVRNIDRAKTSLPNTIYLIGEEALDQALANCDAVINLAGENIASGRWTKKRKERLWKSRVDLTQRLIGGIERAEQRPSIFISASAIGYYPANRAESLDETSEAGVGFAAQLCDAWEKQAHRAKQFGLRVAIPRLGVVIGPEGAFVKKLAPLARLGLAGPLGKGSQPFHWIHLDDVCQFIINALSDERYHGPFNLIGPEAISQKQSMRQLANLFHRSIGPRAPAFVLKTTFGEAASLFLDEIKLGSKRLEELGFVFIYQRWQDAAKQSFLDIDD